MSVCISIAGEYSAHEPDHEGYTCTLCGAFDEESAIRRIKALEAAISQAMAIEEFPYRVALMQDYELDHAQGYNDARTEFRRALSGGLSDGERGEQA
jgi:hypothetical protein